MSIAIIFANLRGNIGDFALLHAAILDASDKFPGHQIDVYAHSLHDIDQKRLAVLKDDCAIPFEVVGRNDRGPSLPLPLYRAAKSAGAWPYFQAHLVDRLARRPPRDGEEFSRYAAVLYVGGSQWYGSKLGVSMFGTLGAVRRVNPRIYAYPFSVTHKLSQQNRPDVLKRYFGMLDHEPIVRDAQSHRVMTDTGLTSVLAADSVFSLNGIADDIAPASGANPSRIMVSSTNTTTEAMMEGVGRLVVGGREVVLMTTFEDVDSPILRPVAERYGLRVLAPLSWRDAIAEIKASSLLAPNPLHGLIFSCLAKTPVLPLTNVYKAKAFAEDAGVPHMLRSDRELDMAVIDACERDRDRIGRAIASYGDRARTSRWSPLGG